MDTNPRDTVFAKSLDEKVEARRAYEEAYDGDEQNITNLERGISIGVGALLVYSALKRFRKSPFRSLLRAAVGAGLIERGTSGNCRVYRKLGIDGTKTTSVNFHTVFTVNKPRLEVYEAWRNLGSLPKFMKHLKSVEEISPSRSHWEAKIPEGNPLTVSWDADIVKDEPGELLSWKSVPGSKMMNAGKIEFRDALGHRGTELRVTIIYRPPAGNIGAGVGKMLNPLFRKIIRSDVMQFKEYIEFTHTQPA